MSTGTIAVRRARALPGWGLGVILRSQQCGSSLEHCVCCGHSLPCADAAPHMAPRPCCAHPLGQGVFSGGEKSPLASSPTAAHSAPAPSGPPAWAASPSTLPLPRLSCVPGAGSQSALLCTLQGSGPGQRLGRTASPSDTGTEPRRTWQRSALPRTMVNGQGWKGDMRRGVWQEAPGAVSPLSLHAKASQAGHLD